MVPQRVEGETIEPQVSVPMANATSPAAVAEADPAEDPDCSPIAEKAGNKPVEASEMENNDPGDRGTDENYP